MWTTWHHVELQCAADLLLDGGPGRVSSGYSNVEPAIVHASVHEHHAELVLDRVLLPQPPRPLERQASQSELHESKMMPI